MPNDLKKPGAKPDAMKRAAFYGRFSTDLQNDRSIDDQLAYVREWAAANGYEIVAVFKDVAITGAFLHQRSGMTNLLADAKRGGFEFIIAESMSRIGRNQEDRAAVRNRLTFAGVQMVTPADGIVSPIVDGIRAVLDSEQLIDMKRAIRRGLAGVVRAGRHAGGKPYGYRVVRKFDAAGELVRGLLEPDPMMAPIVLRIFSDFVGGKSAREIASELNIESVPAPRGAHWRSSTIYGHSQRSTGIVQNPIYAGRLVWNRAHTPRDPDTFKRVRRAKPKAEWQEAGAEHLRIVSDEIFEAAQRVRAQKTRPAQQTRKPKRMLSGILRCGSCGAGMSIKDHDWGRPRIVCTQMKEAGNCGNRTVYYLDEIEKRVLSVLTKDLGSREAIGLFIRTINEERRQGSAAAITARTKLEARISSIERQITNTARALIEERITSGEADELLPPLRTERAKLAADLARSGEPVKVVTLHPAAVTAYLQDLARIEELVNNDLGAGDEGLAHTVRSIVELVTVMPAPAGTRPVLKVQGQIERWLGISPGGINGADGGI